MAITNGQTVTKADLDAMLATSLAALQDDNEQAPAGFLVNFFFHNLVAATVENRRKSIFVVPHDCYVEVLAAQAADHAATTLTVTLEAVDNTAADAEERNPLVNWPITVAGVVGAGITKLARLFFDNTATAAQDFATTSRAFRVFLKGGTWKLTVADTAGATTPNTTQICIVSRELWSRE